MLGLGSARQTGSELIQCAGKGLSGESSRAPCRVVSLQSPRSRPTPSVERGGTATHQVWCPLKQKAKGHAAKLFPGNQSCIFRLQQSLRCCWGLPASLPESIWAPQAPLQAQSLGGGWGLPTVLTHRASYMQDSSTLNSFLPPEISPGVEVRDTPGRAQGPPRAQCISVTPYPQWSLGRPCSAAVGSGSPTADPALSALSCAPGLRGWHLLLRPPAAGWGI